MSKIRSFSAELWTVHESFFIHRCTLIYMFRWSHLTIDNFKDLMLRAKSIHRVWVFNYSIVKSSLWQNEWMKSDLQSGPVLMNGSCKKFRIVFTIFFRDLPAINIWFWLWKVFLDWFQWIHVVWHFLPEKPFRQALIKLSSENHFLQWSIQPNLPQPMAVVTDRLLHSNNKLQLEMDI